MSTEIFGVDKFVVPENAREEFLGKVRATHAVLKTQPGFVRDAILEQSSGPGEFNFVTIVEWENSGAIDGARRAVAALHQKINF
jgi:heme-degrading monooxygenase HmoA